ncbi:uncharacterized protein LOC117376441 [Periophthalmus magnuspinnatus]|uniref:uncharacterized protein LOC117376441 n=1 Tax=Periophthalmus magnuspinnatus TaxID=409849 RepID=UPI0024371567|nr:uncharacterized protein LOC117376441 [Periophthalmus magnuspinnatus]
MDDPAANKNLMPCPVWTGSVSWSGDPSQGAPLLPLPTSQQLGLGSTTDSRPIYDQIQASGLNCLNNLPCRVNPQSASRFKTSQLCSTSTSASLFANAPTSPSISNVLSFAQLSQTPLMQPTNHAKNTTRPALYQSTQHLASFQPLLSNQALPSAPQDLPVSLPSCSQRSNQVVRSKPTGVDMAPVPGQVNIPAVPTQMISQWRQNRKGNKKKSPNAQATQRTNTASLASTESRSALMQQRQELLKKLSDLDALLKTMPSEDMESEEASLTADLTSAANDTAPQEYHEESSDFSEGADVPSEDDSSPGFLPVSDEEVSDSADSSSDETPHKKTTCNTRLKAKSKAHPPAKDKRKRTLKKRYTPKSSILVLQCVSKKGKRVYDKKNYCMFCSKPFSKLSRHLEMVHSHQEEVADALQHPKHSKERLNIWNRLKNKGNFAHNKDVLKTGKGFLAAVKRPRTPVQDYEFVHCLYCQGLYISKGLFRHMKKCPEKIKNKDEPKIGKKRLAFRCVLETLGPDISEGFKGLLSPMINDPVTQAILNHKVILQFGESMFKQQGADPNRHENIRQNLRQIARLVLEAQKRTPLKEMEDFFEPANFKHVVSAVNIVAGYNSKTNSYTSPSLAIKLGYQLQKLCSIVESNAIESGDESRAKSTQSFLEVYKTKWNKLVSASALTTLRETKRVKEKSVPSIEDVKCLNSYVANAHTVAENKFREHVSAETYAALAKVILSRVILFNRRKPAEVSGLRLEDFLSRKMYNSYNYSGVSLSDLERTMCRFFTRIEIRGTCGRIVPVLLKQSFVFGLELLVKNREACGVPAENPFLFARPTALTAYSGSTILQNYVKDCGAKSPKTLTTAKIRLHFSAMLQMLNLDENEANQILGPNYQVLQTTRTDVIEQPGTFEDIGTQTSTQWGQNQFACNYYRHAANYPDQSQHAQAPLQGPVPKRPVSDKPQRVSQKNKQKWDEAEVRAVERHMMRFIHGQKIPQKVDCLQCLDAEPEALRARSWKGVKDYVRNRITALKREESRSALKNLPPTNWPSQDTSGYYQL